MSGGLVFDLWVVAFGSLLLGRVLWGTLYITTPSLGYLFFRRIDANMDRLVYSVCVSMTLERW